MHTRMLAFALGLLSIRFFPVLPSCLWLAIVALLGVALARQARWGAAGWFLIGLAWACYQAQTVLAERLSPSLDGRTVWLEGEVRGLPEHRGGGVRFELTDVRGVYTSEALPSRMRLFWLNEPSQRVRAGERWRLAVKLKQPRGLVNPYGFDYEAWLLARHIGATGSVKAGERLSEAGAVASWRDRLRERLLAVNSFGRQGVLTALVVGDGSGLSRQDWDVLQRTGTVHLMVISGTHISLLAGLLFGLVAALARLGLWPNGWPWLPVACLAALVGVSVYGFLAGFGVPVQRAVIMVTLALLWRLRFRHLGIVLPLLLAMNLVLLLNPLASLTPGFWLSFSAVALLIGLFAGRIGRWRWWQAWWRAQWGMALGLAIPLMALQLPISFSGVVANLIAVPWVEFLIVPIALLGSLGLMMGWGGEGLLWLAGLSAQGLFELLSVIAQGVPVWLPRALSVSVLLCGMLAALLYLLPAGFPLRGLSLILALPVFFPVTTAILEGEADVLLLDVGQGLSVLVRTRSHALLYDAGGRQGEFDTGERIVVPLLRSQGIYALDTLLISHADQDHAGGAPAVARHTAVGRTITSEPGRLASLPKVEPCQEEEWQWDGVRFSTWHWSIGRNGNERSCVLRVEANGETLLLTGDIPVAAEHAWLAAHPQSHIDWLLAPHHGSRTSSGEAFVTRTSPQWVLISRGWNNPYRHPHPNVMVRYERIDAATLDTAYEGAVTIHLGQWREPEKERGKPRFWRVQ